MSDEAAARGILFDALGHERADPNRRLLGGKGFPVDGDAIGRWPTRVSGGALVVSSPTLTSEPTIQATGQRNLVIIGEIKRGTLPRIKITGSGNVVLVGQSRKCSSRVEIIGDDNLLYLGPGATCNMAAFILKGHDRSIIVGGGCMLSNRIVIRASDSHGIFDMRTGEVVNAPESVVLHPHVWVGERVTVLKGVTVGAGSVIGSGSIVTGSIEHHALAVGTPAKVVRRDVSWTRSETPDRADVDAVRSRLAEFGAAEADPR